MSSRGTPRALGSPTPLLPAVVAATEEAVVAAVCAHPLIELAFSLKYVTARAHPRARPPPPPCTQHHARWVQLTVVLAAPCGGWVVGRYALVSSCLLLGRGQGAGEERGRRWTLRPSRTLNFKRPYLYPPCQGGHWCPSVADAMPCHASPHPVPFCLMTVAMLNLQNGRTGVTRTQ
jgi:hypothetical protein